MKKDANVTKVTSETKAASKSKKSANVEKITLQSLAEKIANVEVKEKKQKSLLYIYPEGWTQEKINSVEGKKFRNKMRNSVNRFANNILVNAKQVQLNSKDKSLSEKLEVEVKNFKTFYKNNFLVNNFSIESISQKKDEKLNDLKLMLEIVKTFEK